MKFKISYAIIYYWDLFLLNISWHLFNKNKIKVPRIFILLSLFQSQLLHLVLNKLVYYSNLSLKNNNIQLFECQSCNFSFANKTWPDNSTCRLKNCPWTTFVQNFNKKDNTLFKNVLSYMYETIKNTSTILYLFLKLYIYSIFKKSHHVSY